MRLRWIFLVVLASVAFAQPTKPVADRLAAQNALFDDYYETELRNRPEMAPRLATTATTTS